MTTFFLIRHGETDAVGKKLTGWQSGWHLNNTGRAQTELLAEKLARFRMTAIYSSPLERALETAAPIARAQRLTPTVSEEFGEFRFGEWEGASLGELENQPQWKRFNELRSVTPAPGGELMIEVQARIVRQLERLRSRHTDEVVAVVSHGDPLRSALAHYLGIPLDMIARFEVSPASVSVVQLGHSIRVLCVNQTEEIPS
jgi:probable phosphoglycerate mutase